MLSPELTVYKVSGDLAFSTSLCMSLSSLVFSLVDNCGKKLYNIALLVKIISKQC